MPTLLELQEAFRQAILSSEAEGLAPAVAGDGLAPVARIAIYRNHVLSTLTDVLRAAYPVVSALVDPRFFGWAADRYIRDQPPGGPCLFEYGASFPEFLAGFPACRHLAYLPDVARLEWALHSALHAEDAVPVDLGRLGEIPPEDLARLRVRLDPSITLLASPWPIADIWRAHRPGAEMAVDLGTGGVRLEIRRVDDEAAFRPLPAGVFAFRAALHRGETLGAATEAGLATDPGLDLAGGIHDLFAGGGVTGITLTPDIPDVREVEA